MTAELRVFVDADVLIAGSASSSGASHIVLQLSDLTLIQGLINDQVQREAERNLKKKLPQALPFFREIIEDALTVVNSASPESLEHCSEHADPKDVPILASAVEQECDVLLTFNTRDYHPPEAMIKVVTPGTFLRDIRQRLSSPEPES